MSSALFDKGRDAFLEGLIAWATDTIKVFLLDMTVSTTGNKLITAASNATPIVITSNSHGFTNGDKVVVRGVGGNTAANGTWLVQNAAANTFELATVPAVGGTSLNSTGNGVYTSGGSALDLSLAQFLSDVNGGIVGVAQTITGASSSAGIANGATVTFTGVSGNPVQAFVLYKDTGVAGTSRVIAFIDGKAFVRVDSNASGGATSIIVEPLSGAIPNTTVLVFSNGVSATLSAQANQGDRVLTVNALANPIAAGHTADALTLNVGLPITPNGGNISVVWDAGTNKIFKL